MSLSAYWQWKLADERARISAVILNSLTETCPMSNGTKHDAVYITQVSILLLYDLEK